MAMVAYFEERAPKDDRRRNLRRALKLGVGTGSGETVTIHDLSLTGALLETSTGMLVGSAFEVDLPQAGSIEASIVWNSGEFYGCQFNLPISPAVLSAALLQSQPQSTDDTSRAEPDPLTELQQLNAEVEQLAWKMEGALKRLTKK